MRDEELPTQPRTTTKYEAMLFRNRTSSGAIMSTPKTCETGKRSVPVFISRKGDGLNQRDLRRRCPESQARVQRITDGGEPSPMRMRKREVS